MRVRYGKPIKVINLLGKQDIQTTISSHVGNYASTSDGFTTSINSAKKINIENNHIYLLIGETEDISDINTEMPLFIKTYNSWYYNHDRSSYFPTNSKWCLARYNSKEDSSGEQPAGFWFKTNTSHTLNKLIVLDLTSLFGSGKEPTAQEFYNKYNKYFPLIATGEEITIDDKAGQIAYKNLEEDSIRCKVAGGSSDIYYGYNQLLNNTQLTDYFWGSAQDTNRTFTEEMITIEFNSTFNTTLYFGQKQNITAIKNHKCIFRYDIKGDTVGLNIGSRNAGNLRVIGTSTTDWQTFETIGEITDLYNPLFLYLPSTWANHTAYIRKVNFIDLTEWFGAGKEPSTVAEFKEKFSKEYYGACLTPIKLTRYQIEALPNYSWNQIAEKSWARFYPVITDVTATTDKDGFLVLNGTTQTSSGCYSSQKFGINGHKYFLGGCPKGGSDDTYYVYTGWGGLGKDYGDGVIITADRDNSYHFYIHYNSGVIFDNAVFKPQIIDLTEVYGAGNEPTTVAEFKATFPHKYYPYMKKSILNRYQINALGVD